MYQSCIYSLVHLCLFYQEKHFPSSLFLSWYQSRQSQYRPTPPFALVGFFSTCFLFDFFLSFSPSTMSASSSNTANSIISLPNFPTSFSVKLDEGNYMVWLSVIVPIPKSHEVMGIVDGSNPCPPQFVTDAEGKNAPNPAYSLWVRQDQLLLGWLNITLSESVLSIVFGLHTSNQVWSALKSRFASESRSRVSHLK
jgi:hypothetical protein